MPRRIRHCNRLPGASSPARQAPTIPAFIDTALIKPRATLAPAAAIRQMAEDMRQAGYREGGVSADDLEALGFTRAQIATHAADARVLAQQLAGASL